MCSNNKRISFYLYHLFLLTLLIFCWFAVAYSNWYYKQIYGGMTVLEDLRFRYHLGGMKHLYYHPVMIIAVTVTCTGIIWASRKKNYVLMNVFLLFTTAVIIYYFEDYMLREERIKNAKVFLFSYIPLLIYSGKAAVVFIIQFYVFWVTRKALKY